MGFGERLKKARRALKLSGTKLGEKLDVSKQTISHWEKNVHAPDLAQAVVLCDTLKISADYLLRGVGEVTQEALAFARHFDALPPDDERHTARAMIALVLAGRVREPGEAKLEDQAGDEVPKPAAAKQARAPRRAPRQAS